MIVKVIDGRLDIRYLCSAAFKLITHSAVRYVIWLNTLRDTLPRRGFYTIIMLTSNIFLSVTTAILAVLLAIYAFGYHHIKNKDKCGKK